MKILYLMDGDWSCIKQRPHFIAEELAKKNDVLVLYRHFYRRNTLTTNPTSVRLGTFLPIPARMQKTSLSGLVEQLQRIWVSWQIKKFDPDYVWITFPLLVKWVDSTMSKAKLVYDCMDNASGFSNEGTDTQDKVVAAEKQLCRRAEHIFCSSEHLKTLLIEKRNCSPGKIEVVRNAVSNAWLESCTTSSAKSINFVSSEVTVAYFGAISRWLDSSAVRAIVEVNRRVHVKLIGPVENPVDRLLEHPRVALVGPISHDLLAKSVESAHAFILPFRMSELIYAVDPIKLYEYIALHRPVISVRYREIERFEPYVYFYNTGEELVELVRRLVVGNLVAKASVSEANAFLSANRWESRCQVISRILESQVKSQRKVSTSLRR